MSVAPPRDALPQPARAPDPARPRRVVRGALAEGWLLARAGGSRTLLAAIGVLLAAAMLGTAVTVSFSLATGFDRAARAADLPDVIARFDREPRSRIDERLRALPNVEARSYRTEVTNVPLHADGGSTERGVLHLTFGGRRGYGIVEGRDAREPGEVVVERGLAREWDLSPGDELSTPRRSLRVVGVAVSPDNVAFPLASGARVYLAGGAFGDLAERVGVNVALVWTRDDERVDVTLQQARATSYGVTNLRFITRDGVRVLLAQAAGIVLALLGAFALVTLGAAGVMLAVAAHADVQRRLGTIGVQRALGFPRGTIVAAHAARAALVALPAAALGLAAGGLVAAGPTADLLAILNELPPGAALLGPLALALAGTVALVAVTSAWPAWRATARPPVALLRGGELAPDRPPRRGSNRVAASSRRGPRPILPAIRPLRLGARLAVARRARFAGTVLVLATCVAVVALLLALASLLVGLRDDPGTLGKRYDTSALLPADAVADVRAIPGVAAAAPRYAVDGADSFSLGEPVRLIAFPGDHTAFEAQPLAEGRRVRADDEAEVGLGLASALNLRLGGTLAVQLASGGEARFRIVGIIRALESDGRVAYVRPDRVLDADPTLEPELAIRLAPGADRERVARGLRALGAEPAVIGGVTSDNRGLLDTLAAVLRAVAGVTALVCLYALVQGLALVALERRPTIALLRAAGGGTRTVGALLAGVVVAAALPAAVLGLVLERVLLAPAVAARAAGYADLRPGLSAGQTALVAAGLALLCALAAWLVARRTVRASIVEGLRAE
jgi:ABC-type antimicrobial peptide transport system permease subunit